MFCRQGCKLELRFDKRENHHRWQCPLRWVVCPQGCGKSVRDADLDVSLLPSAGKEWRCVLSYSVLCTRQEHMDKECVRRPT